MNRDIAARNGTMNWLDVTALVLVVIGALNWGLVGLMNFNLVAAIFGADTLLANAIYVIVGLAGLWAIYTTVKAGRQSTHTGRGSRRARVT